MPLNLPPAPTTGDKAWQDWGNAVRTELERFSREISPVVQPSLMVLDPFASDNAGGALTGNASIALTPSVGGGPGGADRTVGLFMKGRISGAFSSTSDFIQAFAQKWGEVPSQGTTIPAGTKGNFSGYEANISTSQTAADATEGAHLFGGSGWIDGGAPFNGLALALTLQTVAPGGEGVSIIRTSLTNNIGSGTGGTRGLMVEADGSSDSDSGLFTFGNWTNGWDAYGHTAVNVSRIHFSSAYVSNSGLGSITGRDYYIDGTRSDLLVIGGGGSVGGAIIYGAANGTNAKGAVYLRNDPVNNVNMFQFDLTAGFFNSNGYWQTKAITAPASGGAGFFRIYMDSADNKLKAIGPTGTITVLAL